MRRFIFVTLLTLLTSEAFAEPAELIRPGRSLNDAPPGVSSGSWLALTPNPWRWVAAEVAASTQSNGGREVTLLDVPMATEALFLVRGIPGLKEGVVSGEPVESRFLRPGQELKGRFADRDWRVRASGVPTRPGDDTSHRDYRLEFTHGAAQPRVIFELPFVGADASPRVLWAGDLDGDQELDFYADVSNDYCGIYYGLFLSSLSSSDKPMNRVAFLIEQCS